MYNWYDGNKKNLRIIEAQIVQKRKNNEPRQKFTGSYKKKACRTIGLPFIHSFQKVIYKLMCFFKTLYNLC